MAEVEYFQYIFLIISVVQTGFAIGILTDKCTGICLDIETCKHQGGQVVPFNCSTSENTGEPIDKVCCDFSENAQNSCGAIKKKVHITDFKSPEYPEFYGGSLICQFQLNLNKDTVGVRIDFKDLKLPQTPDYGISKEIKEALNDTTTKYHFPKCDSDWFFIKGFPDWMPNPLCGDLTGYSTIAEIEKDKFQRHLTIVFIMSSDKYRWHIKLTQISSYRIRKMDYCLWKRMNYWNKSLSGSNSNSSFASKKQKTPVSKTHASTQKSTITWHVSIRLMEGQNPHPKQKKQNPTACNPPMGKHLCSGVLIDDRHVLTLTSCFFSRSSPSGPSLKKSNLLIYVNGSGSVELNHRCFSNDIKAYDVEMITFHLNYGHWPIMHDDLAVIRTKKSIEFSSNLGPVALPEKGWPKEQNYSKNSTFLSPSWGNKKIQGPNKETSIFPINSLGFSNIYKELGISTSGLKNSRKYNGLTDGFLLPFNINKGPSEAPLVQFDLSPQGKRPTLIGIPTNPNIVSNLIDDDDSALSTTIKLYTNISFYRNWIMMTIS